MTKPREKTREELQAEIEDGKKIIRQLENREKMLWQKLSKEERRINPFGTKGALIHPCGRVRSAEGLSPHTQWLCGALEKNKNFTKNNCRM